MNTIINSYKERALHNAHLYVKDIRRMRTYFHNAFLQAFLQKRKVLVPVLVVFAIGISFFLLLHPSKNLSAQADHETYKCYTSITVEPGETLWSIASEYRTLEYKDNNAYIKEVKRINHISDETSLYAGCHLVVPYYTDRVEE